MEIVYCIDTSSLIEMKDKYPMDVFKSLWTNMERLIKDGRLIAPVDVREEIKQGDDELKKWVKSKKKLFVKHDKRQMERVKDVLKDYPFLAKSEKPGVSNADPWLIALSVVKNDKEREELFQGNKYIVVTEESKMKPNKIPAVCRNYNIECINLLELFRKEVWEF
jgi:hypothetical protein